MSKKYDIDLGKGKIKISFTEKVMTSFGGLSLLSAFFKKIELANFLNTAFPIVENSNRTIPLYNRLLSFMLTVYTGGERFAHLLYLGNAEAIKKMFSIEKIPKAATTLTRLFRKIKTVELANTVSQKLWEFTDKTMGWEKLDADWLNFDSSVIVRYGKQEGADKGYNPQKPGRNSHNPLFAFLNKQRLVVNVWNRSGAAKSANNIVNFFNETFARIKNKIALKGIVADAGFYIEEFIKLLENLSLRYIIKAVLYNNLAGKISMIETEKWIAVDKGIWVSELYFKPDAWDKERRYIVVRQQKDIKENALGKALPLFENMDMNDYLYSVMVTNITCLPAVEIWRQQRSRSNDENIIKELKEDFGCKGFAVEPFYGTEAALQMCVLSYNLFLIFRKNMLLDSEKTQRLKTIRQKYFVIPGCLGADGRTDVLRLNVIDKFKKSFVQCFEKIKNWICPNLQPHYYP